MSSQQSTPASQNWDLTLEGSQLLIPGVPTYSEYYNYITNSYTYYGEYVSTEDITNSAFERWFQVIFRQPNGNLTHKHICASD
jgi:hypothetical protein